MVINGRSERELSLKIYLTSLVSKDLEFGFEREEIKDTFKDMSSVEISEKKHSYHGDRRGSTEIHRWLYSENKFCKIPTFRS